ncbi:Glycosyl transferase, group 1 [Stanieria sp. NIES-3757]|nr:Glycosyl transferase, group 1 [Stanieria sp. NIES-3757]
MKIAVIGAKGLPARQGGIEHYCGELYPRMVAEGHSVDLFARSSYIDKPWLSVSNYQGVRVICLPSLPLRGLDAFTNSAIAAIVAIIKGYDIIHFHALGPALFSFIPRWFSSAKILVTCQGLDWQRAKWGRFSSRIIHVGEKIAVQSANHIIVVSRALQTYFTQTYGLKSTYIPNGPGQYVESDPDFPYLKSLGVQPGRYLLFLGRLVPEKRPELLISAFQRLQNSGWKLVLAGGTSDTEDYINELTSLTENNPNIIFTGELKGERLAQVVRGAGLFVLPSDLEGLPLVMLEAMREGIPVLASDIPPHQQLIGEDRGMLFKAGEIDSCHHALENAIASTQKLAQMAQKAQAHIKTYYNWEKITAENLALYLGKELNYEPKKVTI